jgi:fructokinase
MQRDLSDYTVIGLGEVLWDCLPDGRVAGGAPANFACHANALGARGALVSAVGNDDDGQQLTEVYGSRGIDVSAVAQVSSPTSRVDVELDESGSPTYTIVEGVAWDEIPWTSAMAALASRTDAVSFGTLAQRTPESRSSIYRFLDCLPSDCLRVFDVNLRQNYFDRECVCGSLARANILKLNDEELPIVAEFANISGTEEAKLDGLRRKYGLRTVILTMGADGSIVTDTQTVSEHRGEVIDCVDSVGAGDAFAAVCTAGLLLGMDVSALHRHATAVAAWVCGQAGATPQLPASLTNTFQPHTADLGT